MASLVIGVVATIGIAAPAVRGDGDPASDVLLIRDVFYLYNPPPSPALQAQLNGEVAALRRSGFPIKVALVRGPLDLGLVPELFGKPQEYADFLAMEISLQYKGPLLVVMPNGYGVHGVVAAATNAVAQLPKPASGHIDDLAKAAISAVGAIARASGHPVSAPQSGTTRSGSGAAGGVSPALIVGIVVLVAIAAGALLLLLRRRTTARRSRERG